MEIICKNCNTSHYLSDDKIPLETKTGKCKKCGASITVLGKNTLDSKNLSITQSIPPEQEATKNCDFCGEKILAIAKKCRHCGSLLDGSNVSDSQGVTEQTIKSLEEVTPPITGDYVDNTFVHKIGDTIKNPINTIMARFGKIFVVAGWIAILAILLSGLIPLFLSPTISNFLGCLLIVSLIVPIVGLYNPKLVLRWHQKPNRWMVLGYCFLLFVILGSLHSAFMTPEEKAQNVASQKERQAREAAKAEEQNKRDAVKIQEQNKRVAEIWANEALFKELEDIAETGNSLAIAKLALIYQVKHDDKKAMSLWKTLYEKNDANYVVQASFGIGYLYQYGGKGTNQDYEQAAIWLKKAYNQKILNPDEAQAHKFATSFLSTMYLNGKGVLCDTEQAVRLLQESGETEQQIRAMFFLRQQTGIKECNQK